MSVKWVHQYRSIFGSYTSSEREFLTSHICRPAELKNCFMSTKSPLGSVCQSALSQNRKMWEFGYISHALFERGLLQDGRKGLGFACGREILPSLFAQYGCQITATDAPRDNGAWEKAGYKALGISDVFHEAIIDKDKFDSNVDFRAVDMNQIGEDLKDYDFLWSTCALEHLGSLHDAKDFIYRAMKCLKPGGIAVHTTEINLRSQVETKMSGLAILRSIDFIEIAEHLTWKGHDVAPLDFRLDDSNLYEDFAELKAGCESPKKNYFTLKYEHNMLTPFGLIIQNRG